MGNFLRDNADLNYYLDRGVDWEPLVELVEFNYRDPDGAEDLDEAVELYREILELVGEFVANEVAPRAAEIDRVGHELVNGEVVHCQAFADLFDKFRELELYGLCVPRSFGGSNAPMLMYFVVNELLARADVSVMSHYSFHGGIAATLHILSLLEGTTSFGEGAWEITESRFREAIHEIVAGKAWGSMDITEPDAGSDMAALRAVGEQDAEGNWFVSGQKIFLTSGHGKWHFVIARTEKVSLDAPESAGLAGLSMFLVPAYREEDGERVRLATVDRIEEKLGHHGSITAAVTFNRTPAHLVGKRGEGFKYMLRLMNNARIGIGFESLGVMEAAHRTARDYAAQRPAMGKSIDRHEMIADYLDEMEIDIIGLRAIAMAAAVDEEMAERLRFRSQRAESEIEAGHDLKASKARRAKARRLTPLIKYFGGEKAVESARRCLQIHGGNGYMKEYGAEKLLRDSLVLPIYEGTSQIQALMAVKDVLKGILDSPQEFVRRVAQARWRALSTRDSLERRVARLSSLSLSAQQTLITKIATDKMRSLQGVPLARWPKKLLRDWDPRGDFSFALLHAERMTKVLADEAICETLLAQSKKHPERREYLERYLERAEPRCRFLVDEIGTTGQRLLATLAGTNELRDQGKSA